MNVFNFDSSGSLISQKNYNFIANAGWSQIAGVNYINSNLDISSGIYKNYEFVTTGVRNGKGYVDFYQTDSDFNLLVTETIALSGSKNGSSPRVNILPDNSVVSCVYDAVPSTLHITLIDPTGHIIQDYTTNFVYCLVLDRVWAAFEVFADFEGCSSTFTSR